MAGQKVYAVPGDADDCLLMSQALRLCVLASLR
jgi:hypothetical protein